MPPPIFPSKTQASPVMRSLLAPRCAVLDTAITRAPSCACPGTGLWLAGNEGKDPYSSPYITQCTSFNFPFLYSQLTARQGMQDQHFGVVPHDILPYV